MAQAAAAVIRTGWGTEEDILQQRLWDFPCGSNPQPPRTLAWMPGRVLEDKPEEAGKVLSPPLRRAAAAVQRAPCTVVLQILQTPARALRLVLSKATLGCSPALWL